MSRILHIFRKDLRHFWKELLVSLCLLGLYVWLAGRRWNAAHRAYGLGASAGFSIFGGGSSLTVFLLFLSWLLVIVRLVQDERLVGDRQFWLTRPYRWQELLASKAIFLLLFIHAPLLIAQLVMLKLAGFAPLPYLGGLLSVHAGLLVLTAVVFTMATVTSTLIQAILALFVVLLYGLGNSALISSLPNSSMPHLDSRWDLMEGLIALGAIIAVILIQYARRRTPTSWGIIIALGISLTLIGALTPYTKLIAESYPRMNSDQSPGLQLALDIKKPEERTTPPRLTRPPVKPEDEIQVNVSIPLLASAVNDDEIVEINGNRVGIESSGKQVWRSNWQPYGSVIVLPETGVLANFQMPKNIFESVKSVPVTVDLEFALSVFRKGKERWRVVAQEDDFPASRLGLCSVEGNGEMLACRAPLRGPIPLLATANSSETTCDVSYDPAMVPSFTGYYWKVEENRGTAAAIDPVVETWFSFRGSSLTSENRVRFASVPLCPGTPMNFTSLELTRRISTVKSLHDLQLSQYRIVSYRGGVGYQVILPR